MITIYITINGGVAEVAGYTGEPLDHLEVKIIDRGMETIETFTPDQLTVQDIADLDIDSLEEF